MRVRQSPTCRELGEWYTVGPPPPAHASAHLACWLEGLDLALEPSSTSGMTVFSATSVSTEKVGSTMKSMNPGVGWRGALELSATGEEAWASGGQRLTNLGLSH